MKIVVRSKNSTQFDIYKGVEKFKIVELEKEYYLVIEGDEIKEYNSYRNTWNTLFRTEQEDWYIGYDPKEEELNVCEEN